MSSSAQLRWLIIAGVLLLDAMGLVLTRIAVSLRQSATGSGVILFLLVLTIFYTRWRPRDRLADLTHTAAQLMALFAAVGVLSYLVTTTAAPLVDEALAAGDRALGFDWFAWFAWVHERKLVALVLQFAYRSATAQLALIVGYLALTGQGQRNSRLAWELILSLAVIVPLSGVYPAASAWVHYAMTDVIPAIHMPDFTALRTGTMREISLSRMEGLITFPSFHTTLAVLFIAALRKHRFAFWLGGVVNGFMLISIPSEGGHYFVDVIAGALVAVFAIWAAAWIEKRLSVPVPSAALSAAE